MIRLQIKELIKNILSNLQRQNILPEFDLPEIEIECPADKKNGDYSTNVAMQVAKIIKKSPIEIADLITSNFKIKDSAFLERVWAVPPGFINFFLSEGFLQKQIEEIFKKDFGKLGIGKGQKVNVEFISANPTGSLHIGNGRGAFFGDVLANIFKKAGYEVKREYFINDAKKSNQIQELGKTAVGEGTAYLNEYLRLKIKNQKSKIKNTIQKLKNEKNIYGEIGYLITKEIQKDNKDFTGRKLKIRFDNWVSEQKIFDSGKINQIFQWLKNKNLTYEKEGAVWLKTSEFGDEKDWVIIRSDGEPSYFLSDIAYHKDKIDRGFDKIIDIWGADHQGHVGKMKAAMKMLGHKGDLNILISQIVRLKTGKMSKRAGQIIALEQLIDEVGLDVARFFYLTKSLNTQMEFDLDLAREQSEKNPVYYIQYAYTRICGILRKFGKFKIRNSKSETISKSQIPNPKPQLLNHPSELNLMKQLIKFPEIIEDVAKDYQVQRLPQYAIDLATSFHQFYRDCRVLGENKDLEKARLSLILATKIVLKNTLDLMGISAPEKM